MQDDQVAEHSAEDEQRHGSRESRDEPLALARLQGRQEEREELPEDDRRRCDDRHPERDLELDGERVERVEELQIDRAVLALRQKVGNGKEQKLPHRAGSEVEHAYGDEEDDDDADETHAQLAQMLHQGHSRGTDRHYSSPPAATVALCASADSPAT